MTLTAGEENATVSWSRNGKPLKVSKKDKRVKIGYNSKEKLYFLEIACATVDNAGEYSVTASSDGGEVSSTVAVVTVEPSEKKTKPMLPQLPEAISVKEGEDVKISCTITGSCMIGLFFTDFVFLLLKLCRHLLKTVSWC